RERDEQYGGRGHRSPARPARRALRLRDVSRPQWYHRRIDPRGDAIPEITPRHKHREARRVDAKLAHVGEQRTAIAARQRVRLERGARRFVEISLEQVGETIAEFVAIDFVD